MKYPTLVVMFALALPTSGETQDASWYNREWGEASANSDDSLCRESGIRNRYEEVFQSPERADVIEQTLVVRCLWQDGDRERAYFWYCVFWARNAILIHVLRASGGEYGELEMPLLLRLVGAPPTEWAMSDPDRAKAIMLRAVDVACRLPSPPRIADEYSVLAAEAQNRVRSELARMNSDELATPVVLKHRQEVGLYVGPWKDPGRPLSDSWR